MSTAAQSNPESRTNCVASQIIEGTMPVVDGVRILARLGHETPLRQSAILDPIVAFESETDDYPSASRRHLYSDALLARMDREIGASIDESRPRINQACREILGALTDEQRSEPIERKSEGGQAANPTQAIKLKGNEQACRVRRVGETHDG